MASKNFPLYLANRPISPNHSLEVKSKYSGEVIGRAPLADARLIDEALAAAVKAERPMRELPAFKKNEILLHCVRRIRERNEELAQLLCAEVGKTIRDSRGEVERLAQTFQAAAEQALRPSGEYLPMDIAPKTEGTWGVVKRVPVGVCSFIAPFNFPLNLAAHKIAPAIAVGCPFILKPASRTPLTALVLGEILAETDLPVGAFSILPCPRDGAHLFAEDERIKLLSFTGSAAVGWDLKKRAGKKKVVLELGGNAACIVDKTFDCQTAVAKVLQGAFVQSGQSCISVQRVFIEKEIYDAFRDELVAGAKKLKSGDPADEATSIGPLISEKDAVRIETWIAKAVEKGAKLLCGGTRKGAVVEASVLEKVPTDSPLVKEEAFGPVVVLAPFSTFDEAIHMVNDSRYGLQAGVFSRDMGNIQKAWNKLEVGGVLIGESSSWRLDAMPYGGVKDSGFGREGVKYAMDDMSEPRLLVFRGF